MTPANAQNQQMPLQSSGAILSAIQSSLRNEETLEALHLAHNLRNAFPRDIFALALYKQIGTIAEAKRDGSNTIDTVRESVPLLIERAIESTRNSVPQKQKTHSDPIRAGAQRLKELGHVKAQYLSLADGFMRKGHFENALAEVRRALIIDPADETAKGYAVKLEELVKLQTCDSPPDANSNSTSHHPNPTSGVCDKPPSLEELVTMTKTDFDSIVERTAHRHERPMFIDATPTQLHMKWENQPVAPKRRSMNSLLLGSAFFMVLAIGASYFIASTKEPDARPEPHEQTAAASVPVQKSSPRVTQGENSLHESQSHARSDSSQTSNLIHQ